MKSTMLLTLEMVELGYAFDDARAEFERHICSSEGTRRDKLQAAGAKRLPGEPTPNKGK